METSRLNEGVMWNAHDGAIQVTCRGRSFLGEWATLR